MTTEILGEVTVPSGIVMLIDFGLMDLWTHDKPPLITNDVLSPEALKSANEGADFAIEGADALEAGLLFDRQPHPLFLYDIPRHGVDDIKESFQAQIGNAGYNARLQELPQRVPPRTRVDYTIAHFKGAGEVFLHGVHIIAVSGLPKDRPLQVVGEKLAEGEFADHWKEISLIINPDAKPVSSRKIGHVAVDMARLMFCDVDAAGKWQHEESIDGLADFVFWGKDANRLVNKFNAPQVEGSIYGFVDQPIESIAPIAMQVQEHLELHHLVAATDFRPHSDHWRMLKSLSERATESGVIDLSGARTCGFMTSWGDGFFPVHLDLDESGTPIRIRIELATEQTLQGMRMVNRFN